MANIRVPTAPPHEATVRIQLPWAEAPADGIPEPVDEDTPAVNGGGAIRAISTITFVTCPNCNRMVAIADLHFPYDKQTGWTGECYCIYCSDDGPTCDGTPTPVAVPIPRIGRDAPTNGHANGHGYHKGPDATPTEATRALAVLTIGERLAVMKAIEVAAKRAGLDVGVAAMPYQNPTAVHLQASDWRAFTAWLKGAAHDDFRDVGIELCVPIGKREAARYTLRCLADAAPEMLRLRVGQVLYLPFREGW